MKKKYNNGGKLTPFEQAFASARKAGQQTFPFGGKTYHTRTKEEEAARTTSGRPVNTPEPIAPMPTKKATSVSSSGASNTAPVSSATAGLRAALAAKNAASGQQATPTTSKKPGPGLATGKAPATRKEARFEKFKDRVDARMARKRKRMS